jgi:3-hydroxyisobutyrate dehydrogenase
MSELIAFIGVGNMGLPMAENLMKSGKKIRVFDVSKNTIEIAQKKNLDVVENLSDLVTTDVTTVITMLPEGKHSKEVFLGENGIINKVSKDCLLIDCSTIDIQTSKEIGKKATENGIKMIDAPVSGGVMGAQKATLNIMVGGTKEAFDLALPLLKIMGKKYFSCRRIRKWKWSKDL